MIQAEIESRGIPTASITMLHDITRKIHPPRVLEVDYPLGYPLGQPGDEALHLRILERLLAMTSETEVPFTARWEDPATT